MQGNIYSIEQKKKGSFINKNISKGEETIAYYTLLLFGIQQEV